MGAVHVCSGMLAAAAQVSTGAYSGSLDGHATDTALIDTGPMEAFKTFNHMSPSIGVSSCCLPTDCKGQSTFTAAQKCLLHTSELDL